MHIQAFEASRKILPIFLKKFIKTNVKIKVIEKGKTNENAEKSKFSKNKKKL